MVGDGPINIGMGGKLGSVMMLSCEKVRKALGTSACSFSECPYHVQRWLAVVGTPARGIWNGLWWSQIHSTSGAPPHPSLNVNPSDGHTSRTANSFPSCSCTHTKEHRHVLWISETTLSSCAGRLTNSACAGVVQRL